MAYFFDEEKGRFFHKLADMGRAPGAVYFEAIHSQELEARLTDAGREWTGHHVVEATLAPEVKGKRVFTVEVDGIRATVEVEVP